MIQNKVMSLRQTYIRAKDAVTRSGVSPDDAMKKFPFYVEMDKFMGTRPITSPSNDMRLALVPDQHAQLQPVQVNDGHLIGPHSNVVRYYY